MGSGKPRIVTTLKKGATKAVNSVALSTVVIIKQQLVLAVDTAINTVETTTQGPTTVEVNRNDTLTIGPAGSIAVAGSSSNGISGTGDSNTITISGSIRAAGECSFAINCLRLGHPFNTLNDLFVGGRMGISVDGTVDFTTGANHSKLYTFEGTLASVNSTGPVRFSSTQRPIKLPPMTPRSLQAHRMP